MWAIHTVVKPWGWGIGLALLFVVGCQKTSAETPPGKRESGPSETDDGASGSDGAGIDSVSDTDTTTTGGHCVDPGGEDSDAADTQSGLDAGPDTARDTPPDSGDDTDTGTGADTLCPADMVRVSSGVGGADHPFCIDRYEASRPDATATFEGTDESLAVSREGVLPWYVNPMTAATMPLFETACEAAGKRICSGNEWFASCSGEDGTKYGFGDTFSVETCNCVDTYCDDYCEANGIPEEACNLSSNCGYSCGETGNTASCFHVVPTGSFPECTNSLGAFDVSGNVWEVVPSSTDDRGYEVRGGAFNCAGPSARLQCEYNADWDELYAGFRCCKDAS